MVWRKTLWELTLILLGDDKRMVRGECKYRSEEWLCTLLQLLAHIADELLIPNAPITIEIILAVHLLIVLTAIQMLHTRSAGKSTKAHRAVIGATEEHCAVALILQNCRQGTGLRHCLWHQHKWVLIGWNRRPHRRQCLNGTATIGIHIIECIALTHQRVKERRITLLRLILIEIWSQQSRMFRREALHNKYHHIATLQLRRRQLFGWAVLWREDCLQLLVREVFFVGNLTA